jgi:Ca2+-binding RTX toxin-like protein
MAGFGIIEGNSVTDVLNFEKWAGRDVEYLGVSTGRASWSDWVGSIGWAINNWKPIDATLRWSIPMFANQGNLTDAAAGAYNNYYLTAAQQLASAYPNQDKIIVRVGEEFNGSWMPWAAKGHEADYVKAYQNFVTTFRSVSDKFEFEWNVNVGDLGVDPTKCYPGDDYVDIIGMDFYYDQYLPTDPTQAWNYMVNRKYGLQWLEDFASAHDKPSAYSEWGVEQNNAGSYIKSAAEWFENHNVLYQMYWDNNSAFPGKVSNGQYPDLGAAFLQAFHQATDVVHSAISAILAGADTDLELTGASSINGTGNEYDNIIVGNDGDNIISGLRGYDTLQGMGGKDQLSGGDGNDILDGGTGNDTLDGGTGDDTLTGADGNDNITGGDGNDSIDGGTGNDTIDGGTGNDTITGGIGDDTITGGDGNDSIAGGDGNDFLAGGAGSDTLAGGAGDDTYVVDQSDKVVENAGEGNDSVLSAYTYTLTANVENLLLIGTAGVNATGNELANHIVGNIGDNVLTGLAGDDRIEGGGGNDTMDGGDGNDVLTAGDGSDRLLGGNDNDIISGNGGNDSIDGGNGNDTISGGDGNDQIGGGYGNDIVDGGNGNDQIDGGYGNDTISGGTGDDIITGGLDNDILYGGDGNDTLNGASGNDTMVGGAGNDVYSVDSTGDIVVEQAGEGIDTVQVGISYTLGANVENLEMFWSASINATGNELDNKMTGNAGNNVLLGLGGNDMLLGGDGNDTLDGGIGINTLTGGAGNDIFMMKGGAATTITDFSAGDSIDISALTKAGAQATIVQSGNDLVIRYSTGDTLILQNENIGDIKISASGFVFAAGAGDASKLLQAATAPVVHVFTGDALDNHLVGDSGNDSISGLDGNDFLEGGDGNDTLDGGIGNDTMAGGAGDDTYVVGSTGDQVVELAGNGTDAVNASVSYTLGANVENLQQSGTASINGTGNELGNIIVGNAGNNALNGYYGNDIISGGDGDDNIIGWYGNDTLSGGNGNDTISGGLDNDVMYGDAGNDTIDGGGGNDTMFGGAGDDFYSVDSNGDVVTEQAGEGTDTVLASISYALGANVENLQLYGSAGLNATGNELDNRINGNSGNNTILGMAGNDTLIGGDGNDSLDGGVGTDTLVGGTGNDTYVVDSRSDQVTEKAGEGTDTVVASASYVLSDNVENLQLSSTADINGTGNALDNRITGNTGNNAIDGLAGNDTIDGGNGNDAITGGDGNDQITGGYGNDTVDGGTGNDTIDGGYGNDTLSGGTGDDVMTGGMDNDFLNGGAGNDNLNGGGGNDTMVGGTGDDVYAVDSAGDVVVEQAGEGTDTVQVSITYTLAANVENLQMFSNASINATGNELDNKMTGNAGNNVMLGLGGNDTLSGGDGNDTLDGGTGINTLTGGAGNDIFVMKGGSATSTVTDFSAGDSIDTSALIKAGAKVQIVQSGNNLVIQYTTGDDVVLQNTNISDLKTTASGFVFSAGNGDASKLLGTVTSPSRNLNGGHDKDTIVSAYNDSLMGGKAHNLTLTGNGNLWGRGNNLDNTIIGNNGKNELFGGKGHDVLNGGKGNDYLQGDAGSDTFIIARGKGSDTIGDFDAKGKDHDHIEFEGYSDHARLTHTGDTWFIHDRGEVDTFHITGVTSLSHSDYHFG